MTQGVTGAAAHAERVVLSRPPARRHDHPPEDVYGSWSPAPAPDGRHVAFISDRSGDPQIWMAISGEPGWRLLVETLHRVMSVSWSPDGNWLACTVPAAGASRNEVFVVRPDGSDLRQVAGLEHSNASLAGGTWQGWSADGTLLLTEESASGLALAVDPRNGERQVLAQGHLLSMIDLSRDGRRILARRGPRTQRRLVTIDRRTGVERELTLGTGRGSAELGCFSADGRCVYARSTVGRDRAALLAARLDDDGGVLDVEVLAERSEAELEHLVLAPDGAQLALTWNLFGGHSAVSLLDLARGAERELGALPRDVVTECRFTPDAGALLLTAESWSDPRGVWRVDLSTQRSTPISSTGSHTLTSSVGASVDEVDEDELVAPRLVRFRSTDGTPLSGWLYSPRGTGPFPAMIHLHGGPEGQERPVYNSLFQSLADAGVAVFAPNVRGSAGFGRAFVEADDLHGRYGAIEDVAACARLLVDAGIAAPGRVGCMGRSYGGYLTLAALAWHPDLFAVGIDVCGMSNLLTFYERSERWIGDAAVSKYGHPEHDRALLAALSPLSRVESMRAPLLVVHGAEDTNVPVHEAEQIVAALAERGMPHRYLLFEGEGHELLATPNRVIFVQETLAWVMRHLSVTAAAA